MVENRRVALYAWTKVGLNVTPTVQFAAGARLAPQVLLAMANAPGLVPPSVTDWIVNDNEPVLVSVTVWAADVVFTATVPKLRLNGKAVAMAWATLPLNVAAGMAGLALVLTESVVVTT